MKNFQCLAGAIPLFLTPQKIGLLRRSAFNDVVDWALEICRSVLRLMIPFFLHIPYFLIRYSTKCMLAKIAIFLEIRPPLINDTIGNLMNIKRYLMFVTLNCIIF